MVLLWLIMVRVALYLLSSPNHNDDAADQFGVGVALYLLSSPNHNRFVAISTVFPLRYIFFHHQTTTCVAFLFSKALLRYIFFHHQTTTAATGCVQRHGCVISSFITKPQPFTSSGRATYVALYLLSSPNHNSSAVVISLPLVALYLLSSPNHNRQLIRLFSGQVALYLLSSPNHNLAD